MLHADPYSLRSLGGVLIQASGYLRNRANRVQQGTEELLHGPTGWRGDAPQAFRTSCNLWNDDLLKICNTLERASSTLTQLANRVEHIEQLRQEARQCENACWNLDPQNPQEQYHLQYLRSRARDLYTAAEMESFAADQQAATAFREMETVEKSLNLMHSPVWQQYERNLLLAKLKELSKPERMGYYDAELDEEVFQQDFGKMGNEELRAQIRGREERQQQASRDDTDLVNQGISMVLDFLPVVGNVKSAVEAISGKDYITGEELTKTQRIMSGAGLLYGGLKYLAKVVRAASKGLKFARFESLPQVEKDVVNLEKESTVVTEVTGRTFDSIPSVRNGEFNKWFNSLTPDEFDRAWADPKLRDAIKDRLRYPGGLHEWHLVSRADVFKRWGVTSEQIAEMRTLISETTFVNPTGKHGGKGSTKAHNELLEIIDSSIDYDMFKRRLQNWANYRFEGGAEALPNGLKP